MGENSNETGKTTVVATDDVSFSPGTASSSSTTHSKNKHHHDQHNEENRTPTSSRRIIKATPPTPSENKATFQVEEREDSQQPGPTNVKMTTREEDPTEDWRKSRFEAMQERQRKHREKEFQDRRQNAAPRDTTPTANPMSRFLSIFSVEPQFPDHKRAHEDTSLISDNDLKEPSEKRLKSANYDDEMKSSRDVPSSFFPFWNQGAVLMVSAAAVAAIAVFVAGRLRGRES